MMNRAYIIQAFRPANDGQWAIAFLSGFEVKAEMGRYKCEAIWSRVPADALLMENEDRAESLASLVQAWCDVSVIDVVTVAA
jgi:hypothetical protein